MYRQIIFLPFDTDPWRPVKISSWCKSFGVYTVSHFFIKQSDKQLQQLMKLNYLNDLTRLIRLLRRWRVDFIRSIVWSCLVWIECRVLVDVLPISYSSFSRSDFSCMHVYSQFLQIIWILDFRHQFIGFFRREDNQSNCFKYLCQFSSYTYCMLFETHSD